MIMNVEPKVGIYFLNAFTGTIHNSQKLHGTPQWGISNIQDRYDISKKKIKNIYLHYYYFK